MNGTPNAGTKAAARDNIAAVRTVLTLDGAPADPAQIETLRRFRGWGAHPQLFDEHNDQWRRDRDALRGLLDDQQWDAARRSTINAHYTSAAVIDAMWEAAGILGFDGGDVLEPGAGIGRFIDRSPHAARFHAVELEPLSAAICRAINPAAQVTCAGFETLVGPVGHYDLAIGNVPFADVVLHDPVHNRARLSMHNHFIVKALSMVRPGGLVMLITSAWTMDAKDPHARLAIAELGDLLGAVRLPATAFAADAGTKVVTDVLIFQRRPADRAAHHRAAWLETVPFRDWGHQVPHVNQLFKAKPRCVVGDIAYAPSGGMYGANKLTVTYEGDPAAAIRETLVNVARAAAAAGRTITARTADGGRVNVAAATTGQVEDGIYRSDDSSTGWVTIVDGAQIEWAAKPAKDKAEAVALLDMRDMATRLIAAESADQPDAQLDEMRTELAAAYDAYVARWGAVNRCELREIDPDDDGNPQFRRITPKMGGVRQDPGFQIVEALEVFDDETGEHRPAPILSRRVIRPHRAPDRADSPADALAVSLAETGRVDLALIARLCGVDETEARASLGSLVFDDPETGMPTSSYVYLSGDIRPKLAAARHAAASDPERWAGNVTALETVLPEWVSITDIVTKPGAPWITADDVALFLHEVVGGRPEVCHLPVLGMWSVQVPNQYRESTAASLTWGTPRVDAYRLIEAACKSARVKVYDEIDLGDGSAKKILNRDETLAAAQKQDELIARFAEWVIESAERVERIEMVYNERFNSFVAPSDPGEWVTLPGASLGFELRDHQRRAIARAILEGGTVLGHEVGAGKTVCEIATAWEWKRLGRASKPMIAVPNHLVDQFARTARQMYPAGRILVCSDDRYKGADGRRRFAGHVATSDWDLIICPHKVFDRLPFSPEVTARFLEEQIAIYQEAIDQANALRDGNAKRAVKAAEKAVMRMEERHKALLADQHKDPGVTFDQLGVGGLVIDEAHFYKNLALPVSVQGVGGRASQRAEHLAMTSDWLHEQHGPRRVMLGTGTPLSNGMIELWVMHRLADFAGLTRAGFRDPNTWLSAFAQVVTRLEVAPDGSGYRLHDRLSRYVNRVELLRLFLRVADIKLAKDLDLPLPDVDVELVQVPGSPGLVRYLAEIGIRAEDIRNGKVEPTEDNMLKVCGDGKKAALDLRLVGRNPDPAGGKIAAAADRIAEMWRQSRRTRFEGSERPGVLQLVFCDLGTPKPGDANVYGRLRDSLVRRGVPAGQIAFIHDAATDADRAQLFARARNGEIAVLVASTEKGGTGVNVQTRCRAIHHMDWPFRPDQVTQRNGRGIRQGNQCGTVSIYNYVTEGSFDAYVLQLLEMKSRFIAQALDVDSAVRVIDEIPDVQTLGYSELKAAAAGSQEVRERAEIDLQLGQLRRYRALHRAQQRAAEDLAGAREATARRLVSEIKPLRTAKAAAEAWEAEHGPLAFAPGDSGFDVPAGLPFETDTPSNWIAGQVVAWKELRAANSWRAPQTCRIGRFGPFEVRFAPEVDRWAKRLFLRVELVHRYDAVVTIEPGGAAMANPARWDWAGEMSDLVAGLGDEIARKERLVDSNLDESRRAADEAAKPWGRDVEITELEARAAVLDEMFAEAAQSEREDPTLLADNPPEQAEEIYWAPVEDDDDLEPEPDLIETDTVEPEPIPEPEPEPIPEPEPVAAEPEPVDPEPEPARLFEPPAPKPSAPRERRLRLPGRRQATPVVQQELPVLEGAGIDALLADIGADVGSFFTSAGPALRAELSPVELRLNRRWRRALTRA